MRVLIHSDPSGRASQVIKKILSTKKGKLLLGTKTRDIKTVLERVEAMIIFFDESNMDSFLLCSLGIAYNRPILFFLPKEKNIPQELLVLQKKVEANTLFKIEHFDKSVSSGKIEEFLKKAEQKVFTTKPILKYN